MDISSGHETHIYSNQIGVVRRSCPFFLKKVAVVEAASVRFQELVVQPAHRYCKSYSGGNNTTWISSATLPEIMWTISSTNTRCHPLP